MEVSYTWLNVEELLVGGGRAEQRECPGFRAQASVSWEKAECAAALKEGMEVLLSRGEEVAFVLGHVMLSGGDLELASSAVTRKEKDATVASMETK